jgi:hypothetical protein
MVTLSGLIVPHYSTVALSGLIVYSSVHIRGCCSPGVAAVTDA